MMFFESEVEAAAPRMAGALRTVPASLPTHLARNARTTAQLYWNDGSAMHWTGSIPTFPPRRSTAPSASCCGWRARRLRPATVPCTDCW